MIHGPAPWYVMSNAFGIDELDGSLVGWVQRSGLNQRPFGSLREAARAVAAALAVDPLPPLPQAKLIPSGDGVYRMAGRNHTEVTRLGSGWMIRIADGQPSIVATLAEAAQRLGVADAKLRGERIA